MKKVWYAPNKLEAYGEEEIKAVEQCLRDGWLAGFGPRTIEFEEKNIADGHKIQDLLELVPNAKTMPQIWLNEEHIGGYHELEKILKE